MNIRTAIATLIALIAMSLTMSAQDAVNRAIYERIADSAAKAQLLEAPTAELTLHIAKAMLGTPYVASTLEVEPEELRVFLDKTDCILFVETCICLANTIKSPHPSYELFCRKVQEMRYRNGQINGYASRLHYTSDWAQQAEANGIMKEYTALHGERYPQEFSFMSTHPGSYMQLKDSPQTVKEIAAVEKVLNGRGPYYRISKARLADKSVLGSIREGDVIAFTSSVAGLDVTHVAIACMQDGQMHFIHASTKYGKVVVEPKTLADYVSTGIRVFRLK